MIKHTPYYHKLAAAGAKFQDRGGFATINFLTSIEDEHRAVRERVGIFDVYYQVAVEVWGPDSARLLQRVLTNDVRRIGDGGVLYSPACNAEGGMLDDLTCFRFNPERFWVCPTPSRVAAIAAHLEEQAAGQRATVTNLGYANAELSIQGPRSRDLLATLTDTDLSTAALHYFRFAQRTLAGVPGTVISRTGYSGELGYELFYPVEYAEHLWDAVVAARAPVALPSLRTQNKPRRLERDGSAERRRGLGGALRRPGLSRARRARACGGARYDADSMPVASGRLSSDRARRAGARPRRGDRYRNLRRSGTDAGLHPGICVPSRRAVGGRHPGRHQGPRYCGRRARRCRCSY